MGQVWAQSRQSISTIKGVGQQQIHQQTVIINMPDSHRPSNGIRQSKLLVRKVGLSIRIDIAIQIQNYI